jgi:predicted phosphate transport protein (TIGR00153 family)
MRFFHQNRDFFDLFEKVAANILQAATTLVAIMEHFTNLDNWAQEVRELEGNGDLLTHDIIKKLNKTVIHPIDREDIYALASSLDDILDFIWGTAERLSVFKMEESTKEAVTMSKELLTTVKLVQKAIKKLREKNYGRMKEYCIEINKLENKLDREFKDALGRLFDEIKDPILVIKWKEIYEHLEDASDKCEDVADILETIAIKNAR